MREGEKDWKKMAAFIRIQNIPLPESINIFSSPSSILSIRNLSGASQINNVRKD